MLTDDEVLREAEEMRAAGMYLTEAEVAEAMACDILTHVENEAQKTVAYVSSQGFATDSTFQPTSQTTSQAASSSSVAMSKPKSSTATAMTEDDIETVEAWGSAAHGTWFTADGASGSVTSTPATLSTIVELFDLPPLPDYYMAMSAEKSSTAPTKAPTKKHSSGSGLVLGGTSYDAMTHGSQKCSGCAVEGLANVVWYGNATYCVDCHVKACRSIVNMWPMAS